MISWITFILGVIVSLGLGYFTSMDIFAFWEVLVIFLVALVIMVLVNAFFALLCSKWLPNKLYNPDSKFFTPSKREYNFYLKIKIKTWKDKMLEWGKLNGFSKSKVEQPKEPEYIKRFILECNKGYLTHLTGIFASLVVFVCVPQCLIWSMALPMFMTAFVLNLSFVFILRYNVNRLKVLLAFTERKK